MKKRKVRKIDQLDIYIDRGDEFSFWMSLIFAAFQFVFFYVVYLGLKFAGFFCGFHIWLAVKVEDEHTDIDMLKLEDGDKVT